MARKSERPRKKEKKGKKEASKPISRITPEVRGFLLLVFALVILLSLISFAAAPHAHNLLGIMGHTIGSALHAFMGLGSYCAVFYIGWIGFQMLIGKPEIHFSRINHFYAGAAIFSICMLLTIIESKAPGINQSINYLLYPGLVENKISYHLGGAPFYFLYQDLPSLNLHYVLNTLGVVLIFSTLLIASLLLLFKVNVPLLWEQVAALCRRKEEEKKPLEEAPKEETAPVSDFIRFVKLRTQVTSSQENIAKPGSLSSAPSSDMLEIQPEKNLKVRPSLSRKEQSEEVIPLAKIKQGEGGVKESVEKGKKKELFPLSQNVYNGDFKDYIVPSPNLLTNSKKGDASSIRRDLKRQAEVLEETLLSFGIEAKVGQINCGPTITSFEVHPSIGVKVQKIKALDNDIALNMEAKSIRIIAPIPGKAAVGIEVPNAQPQEVGFKDMLMAYQKSGEKFHIPILLGQAVNGDYVMSDLAKMPHCIIAGATGSGKSVCINTIIMSILLNAKPDQIKLIMVDPKKVELTAYSSLPHMLAPVITEPSGAAAALQWMVKEMEKRYEILKQVGVRNIDSFNKRTIDVEKEGNASVEIPPFMPYIVGIIDELADLMMVASQDIETPIARIAQMARAVGIHLILATQRPSREVITGLIKANFPTRVSFKVASRVNSQIVLDDIGAESLLGNGDMLFLPPGSSHLIRAQGAFIRDEDIRSVVDRICEQAPPNYVIQSFDRLHDNGGLDEGSGALTDEYDTLYEQAKEVVLGTGNASTTFLQRKLKIGYARAASLMDQLEKLGIVGPQEGSKARKIFAKRDEVVSELSELEL